VYRGTTGQSFSVSTGTRTVQVQDPIVAKGKSYWFQQWEGGTPPSNPGDITISTDTTITAVYSSAVRYTLDISVNDPAWGYTEPAGVQTYTSGASVTVTGYPSSGYEVSHWLLDGSQVSGNPCTVTMNANHVLVAVFQEEGAQTFGLTVKAIYYGTGKDLSGGAWVKIDGVVMGVTGETFQVSPGTHTVEVQSTFVMNGKTYVFQFWNYNYPTSNPGNVDITSDRTITAVYYKP